VQAFVKTSSEPLAGEVRRVTPPRLEPGHARVQVSACGICGSDLHALRGDPGFEWVAPPVTMGHEFAGTITEVARDVRSVAVGDRVASMSIQGCLDCDVCRRGTTQLCPDRLIIGLSYDGGLADEVAVPARHLVSVPDEVSLEHAAVAEPLSVAARAVLHQPLVAPGDAVVVSGPGPIGLLCARLAQLSGGDVCVVGSSSDTSRRLPIAESWGMRIAVVGEAGPAEVLGRPPEVWIEASGSGTALQSALGTVRRGGTISVVALYADAFPFFATDAVRNELTIRCSYASAHPQYVQALDLLAHGSVDAEPLLDRFDLAAAPEAFEAAYAGEVVKPLILPTPRR
jgi:L-iditol 2-dehydrogenase